MKPYIVTLTDSDLYNEDDGCGRGQQLDGAEFGGDIQFTNNRRVVCAPSKPTTQPIANQGKFFYWTAQSIVHWKFCCCRFASNDQPNFTHTQTQIKIVVINFIIDPLYVLCVFDTNLHSSTACMQSQLPQITAHFCFEDVVQE
jgi:hypothetical protein